MPFRGKRSNRPKSTKPRSTFKSNKAKIAKPSKPLKNYIKKIVHGNMENKVWIDYGVNQTLTTLSGSPASNTAATLYLLPKPSVNVGHSGRIGNEIRIRRAYIYGRVNLLPYNLTNNPLSTPILVKMWLVSFKTINTALINSCTSTANYFETGTGSVSFQGNVLDTVLSPNKDVLTVHKTKSFELGATYASSGGAVGTAGYFDNSKMTMPFYFSFGNKFRAALKYNDNATNVAENRNCWLITQVVNADGSSTAVTAAEMHYNLRVEYEDA